MRTSLSPAWPTLLSQMTGGEPLASSAIEGALLPRRVVSARTLPSTAAESFTTRNSLIALYPSMTFRVVT